MSVIDTLITDRTQAGADRVDQLDAWWCTWIRRIHKWLMSIQFLSQK